MNYTKLPSKLAACAAYAASGKWKTNLPDTHIQPVFFTAVHIELKWEPYTSILNRLVNQNFLRTSALTIRLGVTSI